MQSLLSDSKVSTRKVLTALESHLEMQKKWKKVGEQGAKRADVCCHQRRHAFERELFLRCM
jgi:hypothetical protein